jgi:hypothetical protein
LTPPEGVLKGSFLHFINAARNPVLAEGVVPCAAGIRLKDVQTAVSGHFNLVSKNIVHASHLIPRNLGGSGQAYNLVPLPREFNTELIRNFECQLETEAKWTDRYLQVFARYTGQQEIPTQIIYRVFEITNGKPHKLVKEKRFLILH